MLRNTSAAQSTEVQYYVQSSFENALYFQTVQETRLKQQVGL